MSALPQETDSETEARPQPAEAAAEGPHLTFGRMLAFGAPGFAGAAMAIPIGILMPRFYSDVVMAPLGTIAVAMAIARSLDALTDPLMGWISDRTHSRWGRRKPWIALGVPPCALVFYLLFAPPESLSGQAAGLWFGVTFALYFLFSTTYQIPHGALGAELALEYDSRSRLFGLQSLFVLLGILVAATAPGILQEGFGMTDDREVYASIAAAFAVLLVVLYGVLLRYVPERPEFVQREANPLVPGVRRALRNGPFRILFVAGLIASIPAAIPGILAPYFAAYVLQAENPDASLGLLLFLYFGTGLLGVPLWIWLAARLGKLRVLVIGASIGIVGSALLFFVPAGATAMAAGIFLLIGVQSSVGLVVLPSMGADVIDYDELLTGKRREAQFGAFWAILPKFVAIPGASIPLAVLAWTGYVPNEAQSETVIFAIRAMIGLFPVAFNVIAILIILRYPISREVHEKIRAGIEAHDRGENAADPLTGRELPPPAQSRVDDDQGWFLDSFSRGELQRALRDGTQRVQRDVLLAIAACALLTAGFVALAVETVPDLSHEPGPGSVLAVVAAGLALTATAFHALRLRPARSLRSRGIDDDRIREHLADTH